MAKPIAGDVIEFLRESNAIENVFDDDSLKQAIYAWDFLRREETLTHGVILKTHKILMLHQNLRPNERGYYRQCDVTIAGRLGLDWHHIHEAMEVWRMNAWLFPEHWQQHHVRYEEIHPFVDGNGRTGRMFMNWQRTKKGLPVLIIKADERQAYYDWFR